MHLFNKYLSAPDYVSGDVKLETSKIYSTQKSHISFEFGSEIENAKVNNV